MVQISTIDVQSPLDVTIPNHLFAQDAGSEKLLVMLPGRGYTNENPVMYYLRLSALQLGWDVLSVQYGFQVAGVDGDANAIAAIYTEADLALQSVLVRGYKQVCIAGKSLGTPLAASLVEKLTDVEKSLLLLTPIQGAASGTNLPRTLAVIGTADPSYSAEAVAAALPHVQWHVFEGLNHGLESAQSWRESLIALVEITAAYEIFLGAS